jgi:glucoamylase
VLKRDLPQGPGWLRYNWDGYGDRPDGGPFQGWGQGRVWPLLTGERAHYELAAGQRHHRLIKTYERFATCGQMMPEQVWDEASTCRNQLRTRPAGRLGGAAGVGSCRVPEAAALGPRRQGLRPHRPGLRALLRTGKPENAARPQAGDLQLRRPIQTIPAGQRCAFWTRKRFEVTWTADGWQTKHTTAAAAWAARVSARTLSPAPGGKLQWTLHWTEQDSWLGYNVDVKVERTDEKRKWPNAFPESSRWPIEREASERI